MVSKTALGFSAERFLVSLKCGTYRHPCEGDGLVMSDKSQQVRNVPKVV